ncbi:MAG TPA: PorP/SprF family type IX secretion system membrane protein [Bacteroidia bacterium]|jgi:type IX secretion system PorP/SprF family membrane protein|nr:PorP/SprF family type IX secretion system membrane protein [Bacteroidia bacterium]
MKKLSIIFLVFTCGYGFSQDPIFLNSNQSLINLNPSFAGTNGLVRNQSVFRDQWPSLSGQYLTVNNSFDTYFKSTGSGLAISYMHDDQARGTLTTDIFNLIYAQHINLCEGKLKIIPSLQVGYFQKTVDREKLNFGNPLLYTTVVTSQTKRNADFSTGLLINCNHFYFGASAFHITQPDEGLLGVSKLPLRLSIHSAYNLLIGEKTLLHFFTRYEQQQTFSFLQLGVDAVFFKSLILGCKYFSQDAIGLNVGYRNNYFSLQTGYDVTINKLAGNAAGSWELSASFNLRNKNLRNTLVDFEKW